MVATDPMLRDPINWAANQKIGNYGQGRRYDQWLVEINSVEHNYFVHGIDHNRRDEDFGYVFPTFQQPFAPVNRIRDDCPSVSGPPFARVLPPGSDRDDRGHTRLDDESKSQRSVRATNQLFQHPLEHLFHALRGVRPLLEPRMPR
jgi:hypothetical protein